MLRSFEGLARTSARWRGAGVLGAAEGPWCAAPRVSSMPWRTAAGSAGVSGSGSGSSSATGSGISHSMVPNGVSGSGSIGTGSGSRSRAPARARGSPARASCVRTDGPRSRAWAPRPRRRAPARARVPALARARFDRPPPAPPPRAPVGDRGGLRRIDREHHARPPSRGLEPDGPARAVRLPFDSGLGVHLGDPDLPELAEMAGQRAEVGQLCPQLGR